MHTYFTSYYLILFHLKLVNYRNIVYDKIFAIRYITKLLHSLLTNLHTSIYVYIVTQFSNIYPSKINGN